MEHIMQFAVNIDDNRIIEELERSAVKNIEKDLKQNLIDKIFDPGWNRHADSKRDSLSGWTAHIVEAVIEKHKDEIIDKAAQYLAESMRRKKVVQEAAERVAKSAAESVLQEAT